MKESSSAELWMCLKARPMDFKNKLKVRSTRKPKLPSFQASNVKNY